MQTLAITSAPYIGKIDDFGKKIGGAKKDRAALYKENLDAITEGTLLSLPLAKVFPRPDLVKMVQEGLICQEKAIILQYWWESVGQKPRRSYDLKKWVEKTLKTIVAFRLMLSPDIDINDYDFSENEELQLYRQAMIDNGFPQKEFMLSPYSIEKSYWSGYNVKRGSRNYKNGTYNECVAFIIEKKSAGTEKKKMEFSVYGRHNSYITPKGKHGIKLKDGFATSSDAFAYIREHSEELEAEYIRLRTIPAERNDWNRPRIGEDYRSGLDVSPDTFKVAFPFRGVEFGNWVTQLERAASLNEAYDALMDLAKVIGITTQGIALNNELALAFGARGSGKYSAHYESHKVVINLTKTRGAGSLAHEWFHALDNSIMREKGKTLEFASDNHKPNGDPLIQLFVDLNIAVKSTDFYTRSCKIDSYKSKPYWGTAIELNARAFEKYVITKLAEKKFINDYLANIRSWEEYPRQEIYPYPTDHEIKILAPYFDNLLKAVFSQEHELKLSA